MGYVALRVMLRKKNITIGQVSRECNIDLNRLYDATCANYYDKVAPRLTLQEMKTIKDRYLPEKPWEEVFKDYDGSEYEFDTVYKSEYKQRKRKY